MKQAAEWICDYQMQLPSSAIIHWQYYAQFLIDEFSLILDSTEIDKGVQLIITKKELRKVFKLNR
ncbi:hypothetical protein, partial [Ornithobacterium rhinotracheale]